MGNKASKSVTIKYWPITAEQIVFPEFGTLNSKDDVGIALSGGGVRAAVLAIGWLQVFHELGVLEKVKYVSSISGGSWTSAPMSNVSSDMTTFLGNIIPPEQCSIKNLNEFGSKDKSHAKAIADSEFSTVLLKEFLTKAPQSIFNTIFHRAIPKEDFWAHTVGKSFFEYHGIDHTLGLNHKPGFPFPIVNGSIIVGGKRGAIPLEFTPLYHGTPVSHGKIDGVYVESKSFTANVNKSDVSLIPSSNPLQGNVSTVEVNGPFKSLMCNEIAGISSSAIAQVLAGVPHVGYDLLDFPEHQYFINGQVKCVDGGSTDNTGTLALIRRNVTKIIVCLACNAAITSPTIADANQGSYGTLAGLFGAQSSPKDIDGVSSDEYNAQRKVFELNKWDELVAALKEKDKKGQL